MKFTKSAVVMTVTVVFFALTSSSCYEDSYRGSSGSQRDYNRPYNTRSRPNNNTTEEKQQSKESPKYSGTTGKLVLLVTDLKQVSGKSDTLGDHTVKNIDLGQEIYPSWYRDRPNICDNIPIGQYLITVEVGRHWGGHHHWYEGKETFTISQNSTTTVHVKWGYPDENCHVNIEVK